MFREELLQFAWKTRLFGPHALKTTCGKELFIISQGEQNFHAGPDFFNAKIRIGATVWAGNVEIHCRASDWEKHGHQLDPAYNNVILHVVLKNDTPVINSMGRRIHTLKLEVPSTLPSWYLSLHQDDAWLPCSPYIKRIPRVQMRHWLTQLQTERLEHKTRRITNLLYRNRLDWDASFYTVLASGFGLPINSLPFEMVVSGIPYTILIQYRGNLADLEGILFGQAGFLQPGNMNGSYVDDLYRRYKQYSRLLSGEPVDRHLWKFLRLRPASFPTLRLSQFASLVHQRFSLLETILEINSVASLKQVLRVKASEYWDTHYLFGKCSPESAKFMGHQAILTLIVNTVVPFLFTFGRRNNHPGALQLGNDILQEMEAESNHIIKKWAKFGINPDGAFESQALIQLHNAYCKQKRCLDCQIGAGMIKMKTDEEQ
jgi:hypothetical protein